jgi:hypothetical protein
MIAALLVAFVATTARADDAGKVVSLEGTVEIGRAAVFTRADVGSTVAPGDTIRTGSPGRARILFVDDSVLNLGDGTTLLIDETVFDASKGAASTLMHLLGGKVRALVSEYYSSNPGSSYTIETTTAVSGVRGTEFIMTYDAKKQQSEVLGLGGLVSVHGTIDRKNHGVLIHANEVTEVAKGKYPTPPRQITTDDDRYRQLMDGLDLPGGGLPETLLLEDPAFGGNQVPAPDTADGSVFDTPKGGEGGDLPHTDLPPSAPGETGGDLLNQPQPVLDSATELDIHF